MISLHDITKKSPIPHAGPPSTGDSNGVPKEEAPIAVTNQAGMLKLIMYDGIRYTCGMCYGNPTSLIYMYNIVYYS